MPISFSMMVLSSHLVFFGHAPGYVRLLTPPDGSIGQITPRERFIDQGLSGTRASRSGALEICIRPANG